MFTYRNPARSIAMLLAVWFRVEGRPETIVSGAPDGVVDLADIG